MNDPVFTEGWAYGGVCCKVKFLGKEASGGQFVETRPEAQEAAAQRSRMLYFNS